MSSVLVRRIGVISKKGRHKKYKEVVRLAVQ
jgi:hypothetical protein